MPLGTATQTSRQTLSGNSSALSGVFLHENLFLQLLYLERRRAERSNRGFMLVTLTLQASADGTSLWPRVIDALSQAKRETDFYGWFESGKVLGLLYTEAQGVPREQLRQAIQARISDACAGVLEPAERQTLAFAFYFFPDEHPGRDLGNRRFREALYPELRERHPARPAQVLKRALDILVSGAALLLLSPLLALIALAIKCSSRGPVLYCQQRVGQFGIPFPFVKFRSMRVASDDAIHRDYVTRFINGKLESPARAGAVYKLRDDPRITPLGRWLRRTSLDELPQLWNILRGQMSLVGPRPAISYELGAYRLWHKHRLLGVKPGLTGLWQVSGRSRTSFDDMVRLDLQYARRWSLVLDLVILLRTPWVVISGIGAY